MPTLRRSEARKLGPLGIIVLAATLLVVGFGVSSERQRSLTSRASSWRGLVGAPRTKVPLDQRALVVLKAPSLAQRVAANGGLATQRQEHEWTREATVAQRQLLTELSVHGIVPRVEFSFTRVLNGFSAPLDARAIALLERQPEVAGVYPVRAAYPASVSSRLLGQEGLAIGAGSLPSVVLPGYDGRGVTIALLDTGVGSAHPYLRGRIRPGINLVDPSARNGAPAVTDPADPSRREEHGTELAGLLVGAGGPGGIAGVATGASLLPIRVAGWQRDLTGGWATYARTDQLIAGLERAVDPNLDGDAHDAARIALVGVAAPYAAFADSPEARAIRGALRLDTLVVAPAGNDGPAGPGYGSISSPGGAPDALTVGAADLRSQAEEVPVAVRSGIELLLDRRLPLAGAVTSSQPMELTLAAPRTSPDAEPDLAAPGVVVATSEPGSNDDGSPRFGTVNGSSAAAAIVTGAAALLAQARPGLRAPDLRSLLAATAHPLGETSVTAQGSGLVDVGAAAATELASEPDTLAFGRAEGDGWHRSQPLTLHNVSTRRFLVRIRSVGQGGLVIDPQPRWVRLKPDHSFTLHLVARLRGAPPAAGSAEGAILLMPRGGAPIRVPWAITFGRSAQGLLSAVALSATAFRPSDTTPAVLSLRAGSHFQDPAGL